MKYFHNGICKCSMITNIAKSGKTKILTLVMFCIYRYNFQPIQRYKALSAEEAEHEFGR